MFTQEGNQYHINGNILLSISSAQHWKLGKRRNIHRQRICPLIKNPVSNYSKLITMVIDHSYRFASRCHCGIFFFSSHKKLLKEICQGQRFLSVVVPPALQPSGVLEPEEMNRQFPQEHLFLASLREGLIPMAGMERSWLLTELSIRQFFSGEKRQVNQMVLSYKKNLISSRTIRLN